MSVYSTSAVTGETARSAGSTAWQELPVGSAPAALPTPHFPSRLHAYVWRNWGLVPTETLAAVVGASVSGVTAIATSMGLPGEPAVPAVHRDRLAMTVLRRNWHLLDYPQLCQLLGWSAERMAVQLVEDDFLWIKLGSVKPTCGELLWHVPTEAEDAAAADLQREVADLLTALPGRPLDFDDAFAAVADGAEATTTSDGLRLVYPSMLVYGDCLADDGILDSVTDAYLAACHAVGVNALWIHVVLSQLAPWELTPELSAGWQARLRRMEEFASRCRAHGLELYLYLNEPRGLPPAFFAEHPDLAGVAEVASRRATSPDLVALCISTPVVQDRLRSAVAHVLRHAPTVGGIIALTYSENLTNCFCRDYAEDEQCPRCRQSTPGEVNARVVNLIHDGIAEANSTASLLLYAWVTPEAWLDDLLAALHPGIHIAFISELDIPFTRGRHRGLINEYSLSEPGPGERALRWWQRAADAGLVPTAKVQFSSSFELMTLPYIPAVRLAATHAAGLVAAGIRDWYMAWTTGGFPSPNIEVATVLGNQATTDIEAAMLQVARRRYGAAAPAVVAAWHIFSDAYAEFPFDIGVLYTGVQTAGPANLLYAQPTGYRAGMINLFYDDLRRWRGPYEAEDILELWQRLATRWEPGLTLLREAAHASSSPLLALELAVAEACQLHFASTANQTAYLMTDEPSVRRSLLQQEIALAERLTVLAAQQPLLGFEATAQHYYLPQDLIEKVLNCRQLLTDFGPSSLPSDTLRPTKGSQQ